MTKRTLVAIGTTCAALAAPAAAPAKIIEIGKTAEMQPPSCPTRPCLAVSRTTGFQAKVGDQRGIFVVPKDGKIVAWTIALGKPGRKQTAFFDEKLGGPASAAITILRPGRKLRYRVVGQSDAIELEPYFGMTAQFPLERTLTVRKGYVVALTVPTWAPALAVGLENTFSWRASRPREACDDTQTQSAQLRRTQLAQYFCLYRTARLTYTATLVTTP